MDTHLQGRVTDPPTLFFGLSGQKTIPSEQNKIGPLGTDFVLGGFLPCEITKLWYTMFRIAKKEPMSVSERREVQEQTKYRYRQKDTLLEYLLK